MTFLNKELHDKWMAEKFPEFKDKLYGSEAGEYLAIDTGLRSGDFPIVDVTYKEGVNPAFRGIIKLTYEIRDKTYASTEADRDVGILQSATSQVIIIRVDKNLDVIDKGHYSLTFRLL